VKRVKLIKDLIDLIKEEKVVYIQTHNFPDHDAVASAYALQYLLDKQGIKTHLIYEGTIGRASLSKMVEDLKIDIKPASEYPIKPEDKIIIVDGCKGNKNVTDLIGDEVAVIDHHETTSPDDVRFSDIRAHLGACSTLIYNYFRELQAELQGQLPLKIPRRISTALLVGILVDTALLSRGVDLDDVTAYSNLYKMSDINYVNALLRNYIQQKDLKFYKRAIENVRIQKRFAFCYFSEGCNQNLLGIIGDFFLALEEVDFVLLCAKNNSIINFSLRSEVEWWNAAIIIQDILKDIGFGGGHSDMAGGIVKDIRLFKEEDVFYKTSSILEEYKLKTGEKNEE
jgi:nanoRNase/pAp phosphatase (c-di-AMP/oligoRNAs hydrolase)